MATALPTPADFGVDHNDRISNPVILRVSDLSKAFGGVRVLDGVSFQVRQGEIVLLRGPNGSGKTTLLNILTGNLAADSGCLEITTGRGINRFSFPSCWRKAVRGENGFSAVRLARLGVGRTWQDIRLFDSQTLEDNLAVAAPDQPGERPWNVLLRPWTVVRHERANRAAAREMLDDLGILNRAGSSGDMVSLGQAKRAAVARALHGGARVVLLDEPLAGLDQEGVASVLGLLGTLARERNVAIVVVEHLVNIPRVLPYADTVWTLDQGRLTTQLPEHVASEPVTSWGSEVGPGVLDSLGRVKERFHLPGGAKLTILTAGDGAEGKPVLTATDLVVRRGSRPVIGTAGLGNGLSFALHEGEIGILEAPNGWGKSTLLAALSGLLPTSRGEVLLEGYDVSAESPWRRRLRGITFLQARSHSFDALTVVEALRLAGATACADRCGLPLTRQVGALSGGEKQRLATLCALSTQLPASVALLDEPFSMLDAEGLKLLGDAIGNFKHGAVLIAVPGQGPPANLARSGSVSRKAIPRSHLTQGGSHENT